MAHAESAHKHAHHFANAHEEFEASKQGMWVFMVTEVLMFGGLFVAYGIFRGLYPEMFKAAHHLLDWKLGAVNTVALITSLLTMVLAVSSSQRGHRSATNKWLFLTFLLGCVFLVVKYFEYSHKIHVGTLPGGHFNFELLKSMEPHEAATLEPYLAKAPLFFSIYFCMTGLHGLHVLIGMGLMLWLIKRNRRGEFSQAFFTPVELVGFYWHFVDLVWIYLFPMLYLVG